MGKMVPITDAADQLRVSRATLDRLAAAGKITKYRRAGDKRVFVDIDQAREAVGFRPIDPGQEGGRGKDWG
jgi:predicted site-specific integrase-resolvase